MSKKLTISEMFAGVIESAKSVLTKEQIEFLEGRKALVENKNASRKATPTQVENEQFKADILEFLKEQGGQHTIGDFMKNVPSIAEAGLANQRVSAIVRQLKEAELVTRAEIKGRAFFSLAE